MRKNIATPLQKRYNYCDILQQTRLRHTMKKSDKKRSRSVYIYILFSGAGLFLVSAGLMLPAAGTDSFAQWYSVNIYPLLVTVIGRFTGLFPFSAAEIWIYLLLAAFFVSLIYTVVKTVRRRNGKEALFRWFASVVLAAGILIFLYTAGCGINYYRRPFSQTEGIVTFRYSADDLEEICRWLTEEVNALSGSVSRDKNGVMELDEPEGEGAVEAMEKLGKEFSSLEGFYPRPKKLAVSEVLSYQGLTGIYLPFTIEANYNGDMTAYNIPFTVCHELSHLRGFMEEREANFIAFLACIGSDRTDFQYSGYLSGWVYCMNALYRIDPERWAEARSSLTETAEPDLDANNAFWGSYEGPVRETAEQINDTYLKVNGQADGVESYDRMVDLIVAYFGEKESP